MYNDSSTGATTKVTVLNCTSANNSAAIGGGMYNKREAGSPGTVAITVTNCILWADSPDEIINENNPIVTVIYSDIKGGWAGCGNIDIDPCFADPCNYDYHLKSQAGRWNPDSQTWVKDAVTSPCIDKGDPSSDWTKELWPHGKRINMGAYGGTHQASMSLSNEGNIADINNDGWVDYNDMALFAEFWLTDMSPQPGDLNRDVAVTLQDFSLLADNWGIQPPSPTPPQPDPMTWATMPYPTSQTTIAMIATIATSTDGSGVEYYFEYTQDPAYNSGWVSFGFYEEPKWEDTGIGAGVECCYRVKARNKDNLVETEWSEVACATTFP
jgi:hypothetical protein